MRFTKKTVLVTFGMLSVALVCIYSLAQQEPSQALTKQATTESAPMLITNREDRYSHAIRPLTTTPLKQHIYDISLVAYDAAFAKERGLVKEFISPMDKGLRWMEIQMFTEGRETKCYYKMILDKSVALDFPDRDYQNELDAPRLNFTPDYADPNRPSGDELRKLTKRDYADIPLFDNHVFLANANYKYHTTGRPWREETGVAYALGMRHYRPNLPSPYTVISVSDKCSKMAYEALPSAGPPSIWIMKKGANEKTRFPQKKNHYIFTVPESLRKGFISIPR